MKDSFIKTAAVTPKIKVADTKYNAEQVAELSRLAYQRGARVVVFPELVLTGYTCGDLFLQSTLLRGALDGLMYVAGQTGDIDALLFVGLPIEKCGKLYSAAAVLYKGEILAVIPKIHIPNYSEFYEIRHFASGAGVASEIDICGMQVPFGARVLFDLNSAISGLVVGCEICEDMWVPDAPDIALAQNGATLIVNLSASTETVGKGTYRRSLVSSISGRLICGYIYASAGDGESSQDLVFGGHDLIAENGSILSEKKSLFTASIKEASQDDRIIYGDIDVERLLHDRRRMNTFAVTDQGDYLIVPVDMDSEDVELERHFERHPFVPDDKLLKDHRCEEILNIQSLGLKKRLEAIGCRCAVIGISGGLDSTLALIVAARAFDMLGLPREGIKAVTMPAFGTTDRTYSNACLLAKKFGAELIEVNIKAAVLQHFEDIGQDEAVKDVTYENSQARERTQVLMDLANKLNGIVIGTGDMSELALGWATYNGDHMSMYGVNGGVPKTLVRHLVRFYADTCSEQELSDVLLDVLDTPVSPELLPPTDGQISQKTEDLVGPYELHDFFLYYVLRFGFAPSKIYRMAHKSFIEDGGEALYDEETIKKWLKTFYRRFFAQQFKRSCLPDGPKVGSVAVSPRGDLRMPTDACAALWRDEAETL